MKSSSSVVINVLLHGPVLSLLLPLLFSQNFFYHVLTLKLKEGLVVLKIASVCDAKQVVAVYNFSIAFAL